MKARVNRQTEEERVFNGALVVLEMHFQRPGTYMRETMGEAKKMVTKTLDLSLNRAEVRYFIPFPFLPLWKWVGLIVVEGRHWRKMSIFGNICRISSRLPARFSRLGLCTKALEGTGRAVRMMCLRVRS